MKFNKALLPGIVWAVVIYTLCALPGKSLPQWEWADLLSVDKLVHCTIFFVLIVLFLKGWSVSNYLTKTAMYIFIFLGVLYGGVLELLQEYVFNDRTGSMPDFIANSAGCLLAVWFYEKIKNHTFLNKIFKKL